MSITFVRVDDRMIHGQTCTRWALEYPCDGIVAVNDAAANNSVLKAAYKSASVKKTFDIHLTLDEDRTPFKARMAPEFKDYFNEIWGELNV